MRTRVQSLDPHKKLNISMQSQHCGGRVKTGRSLRLTGQLDELHQQASGSSERPSLKNIGRQHLWTSSWVWLLTSTCTSTHTKMKLSRSGLAAIYVVMGVKELEGGAAVVTMKLSSQCYSHTQLSAKRLHHCIYWFNCQFCLLTYSVGIIDILLKTFS